MTNNNSLRALRAGTRGQHGERASSAGFDPEGDVVSSQFSAGIFGEQHCSSAKYPGLGKRQWSGPRRHGSARCRPAIISGD